MTVCRASIFIMFLTLLIASVNVNALTVVDVSEEQLTNKAEWIVIGKVLSAYSEKDFGSADIYTFISVRILDEVKGKLSSRDIVLKTIGGRVNDEIVHVPGAADFYKHEEVLLFLERRSDGSLMPIGLMLGKYSIYRDSESGKKIVLRHSDGNGQYYSSPREEKLDLVPEQRMYLNDFRARIEKIVRRGR